MDQTSSVVDGKLKDEAKKNLINKIILGLEMKQIDLTQKKDSASYILDHIEEVKNYSEFVIFLDDLKRKWPIFLDVYNLFNNRFYQEKEKAVIDRLTNYIHKSN